MNQAKVLVVGAQATVQHEKLNVTGLVVAYDSAEDEVIVELAGDLSITTKAEYIHQER